MYAELPFFRYCAQASPCLPHTVILCHSVRSCRVPPLSANDSVVATEKLVTEEPELVKRVSGSRPRLPMRITLFTDAAIFATSSSKKVVPPRTQGKAASGVPVDSCDATGVGFRSRSVTDIIRLGAEAG